MEIIQNWLSNGCDYASGVVIYSNLPHRNALLLKSFQKKDNSFNREKLKYELKKFGEKYTQNAFSENVKNEVAKVIHEPQKSNSENEKKQNVLFYQLPEALRPVLLEANQLFKENCLLKVNLNELPEHAEKAALELQIKIYSNIRKNELCWQKIDLFFEKRIISDTPKSEFSDLTPEAKLRKQQLLYASISKLNTRLIQNRAKLKTVESVAEKSKIDRMISKQETNLLRKNEELITISNLIDGK